MGKGYKGYIAKGNSSSRPLGLEHSAQCKGGLTWGNSRLLFSRDHAAGREMQLLFAELPEQPGSRSVGVTGRLAAIFSGSNENNSQYKIENSGMLMASVLVITIDCLPLCTINKL